MMDTLNTRLLCRATFARGPEVEWWEWTLDEERKVYINTHDGKEVPPRGLMVLLTVRQREGWQLCRAVV